MRHGKHWFKFVLLALAGIIVASLVVMLLWNWLAPTLFGLPHIHFFQALGLLILTRLLFGGFRGRPGLFWRRHMEERWNAMTPEEREKFRAGMRSRWGRGNTGESAEKEGE
ncbi:MAG: hypothetical protein P8Y64_12495 [Gammaproteobacteria bacterium]